MIEQISLHQVRPHAFDGMEIPASEVWDTELTFERGRSYLVEAESGRGKTSLCAYLYGQRTDYHGRIERLDAQGHAVDVQRHQRTLDAMRQTSLAVMPQELRLFDELTPVENVMLKAQLTHHATPAQVREMLCRLGLAERLDTPCARISTGQKQRVAFVRMLCQPADFRLLDEPISHLDAANAEVMRQLLAERQQQEGCAVIVTSIGHTLPYAYDRVLKL